MSRKLVWMLIACALVVTAVVKACSPTVRVGSPEPPTEFGKQETAVFGCPSMQGLYQWPPVAGQYANGRIASNEKPWAGGIPVAVHRETTRVQVDVKTSLVTLRSGRTGSPSRSWAYSERGLPTCRGSMLDFPETPVTGTREDFGCKGIRRGFRLARMKDGALAVGIKTVAYGCTLSIFSWGGQSAGTVKQSDQVYWDWSKLAEAQDRESAPASIR